MRRVNWRDALGFAHAVFAVVAISTGLEENDRLIVRALWLGIRKAARMGSKKRSADEERKPVTAA